MTALLTIFATVAVNRNFLRISVDGQSSLPISVDRNRVNDSEKSSYQST